MLNSAVMRLVSWFSVFEEYDPDPSSSDIGDSLSVLVGDVDAAERRGEVRVEIDREGGIAARMRPAEKTHQPIACRISESPARLPTMNTSLATSRETSAFGRRVRPEMMDGVVEVAVPRTSARRDGER